MQTPELSDVVGAIYDAASESLSWTAVGDQLCGLLAAQRVYLGVPQPDGTLPNLLRAPDPFDDLYSRTYHKVDPFRALSAQAARSTPLQPRARRGTEIMPEGDLLRSDYFLEYARKRGTRASIAGQIDPQGQLLIGIFREGRTGPFSDAHLKSVDFLLPHLRRGLQLRRAFAVEKPTALQAGLAALDVLPIGVVVVDGGMRVIFANAAATRMTADRRAALRILRNGALPGSGHCVLAASHGADSAALRSLVAAAARYGPGGTLRLHSPDGPGDRAPMVAVLVSPAPARLASAHPGGANEGLAAGLAIVVVRDLAVPAIPAQHLLTGLFGLSAGEAAVAAAILGGETAEHVAESRDVSINTVRRQVQVVLRKTEAANLRDLERIAASLASMHAAQ